MPGDDRDYTEKFNTLLSESEQKNFVGWAMAQSAATGRDVAKDLYDYDLKGWWKENHGADLKGGHLTDQYKKPNHPTFSTASQYHGADGLEGGKWEKQESGAWSFTPGRTNLQNFSPDEMGAYFKQVEPGNSLILPQQ